jgi:hypothetical protein
VPALKSVFSKESLQLVLITALAVACSRHDDSQKAHGDSQECPSEVSAKATQLGEAMRRVSLLAPDSVLAKGLRDAYGPLVTPAVLASWRKNPSSAPGREVSNPWPARLEITSVRPDGDQCTVTANVVYVTATDTLSPVEKRPVSIQLADSAGWRVTSYEQGKTGSASSSSPSDTTADEAPGDVVRRYYQAIAARNFDVAYHLWSNGGRASGQSSREFARGFAQTARVHVTLRDSVSIEGAAGSQYATVPVVVDAVQQNGRTQHFAGTYTLRRAMVDGATAEQRQWRIDSADLQPQTLQMAK